MPLILQKFSFGSQNSGVAPYVLHHGHAAMLLQLLHLLLSLPWLRHQLLLLLLLVNVEETGRDWPRGHMLDLVAGWHAWHVECAGALCCAQLLLLLV